MQTAMLGLSVLLLGIAGVVFVGVITDLEPWSQLVILLGVVVVALVVAPPVAHRGLTATAETIAVVGLVVVAIAGYALWTTAVVTTVPGPVYSGLVAGGTAVVGYGYHLLTRLDLPRWTALLLLQPVLPLLAYPLVTGPAGWALVFSLVAAHNAGLAAATGRRPLGYVTWGLHAVAVSIAIAYAAASLLLADSPMVALPGALTLVLAGAVSVAGGYGLRRDPLPDVAAAVLTFAVMAAASRVLVLALPGRALLPVAVVAAVTALGVRVLPAPLRRGPLLAVIVAFSGLGLLVAGLAVRAGIASLVLPPWPESLAEHQRALASTAAATTGWQLAATAAALTVAVALVVPKVARRESTVAGVALTALAAPASLGLGPGLAPWPAVLATAGLALTGLDTTSLRAARVHVAAGSVTALAAAGAALAAPPLTAAVLAALTLTGAVVAGVRPRDPAARTVTEWAAGGATLALPGAAATAAVAAGLPPSGMLVTAFAALCGSLGYAVATELRHHFLPVPVRVGAGLPTVVVAALAFGSPDAILADLAIAVLLVASAVLVLGAPRMDAIRRANRLLDGADLAAAALTAAVVATLARLAAMVLPIAGPDAVLATAATLVFVVTLGVRVVPPPLRRGPVLGVAVIGGVLTAVAGAAAVASGVQVLAAPGPLWHADLAALPEPAVADLTWAAPYALGLFAVAAALVLPRPVGHRASAALGVLAVVGMPAAMGMGWWAPAALATAAGAGYVLSAPWPPVAPRAGTARAVAGGVLLLYAVGAALVRPWTTAAVLGVVMLVGAGVAGLAARLPATDRRLRVGGTAVAGTLLALPAALGALAAQLGHTTGLRLLAALAGATLGLALLAILPLRARPREHGPREHAPEVPGSPVVRYLPYGTAGIAAGATGIAFLALPTAQLAGVYAAAAVLLAVLAGLLRAAWRPPGHRSLVRPATGAMVAAAVPSLIVLLTLAPALQAALVTPYQTLGAVWQGPPPALAAPEAVGPSSVIAALLVTLAAALAAVGFGGVVTRQAVPVVAPGLAVTLLIAPAALDAPWPAGTTAALVVFTIAMLGVALTPPPLAGPATPAVAATGLGGWLMALRYDGTRSTLSVTRLLVLGIGLAAGGAGLAGALADPQLTWVTLGGAVGVGVTAALAGRTRPARLLGWLFAVHAAQWFALVTAYLLGTTGPQLAFAPLAVAAVALLAAARLPRFRSPLAALELRAVEWLGGYVSLLAALGFAFGSTPDLAAVLIAGGAVLGLAALRPGHSPRLRRSLLWVAGASEVAAWWLIMSQLQVGLLEAYTLPFAFFALLVGALEVRYRPELGSWFTWGPGLIAALGPSLLLVLISTTPQPTRQAYVILAGATTLIIGSRLRQQAPVVIGTTATAVAALHLLSLAGPWLVLVPLGLLMLVLAATREKRLRDLQRLRGMR